MDDRIMSDEETLRLVAKNTEADLAWNRASEHVYWALRDITANLLRVVRGAGKPYEIVRQTSALVEALVAYQKAVGHWPPSHELAGMLSFERDEQWQSRVSGSALARIYAQERVVRGALQIVASRLIGQTTQERAGDSEMYDGIRDLEAARVEMQRE